MNYQDAINLIGKNSALTFLTLDSAKSLDDIL